MIECVANSDDQLGELFLEDKIPTPAELKVSCGGSSCNTVTSLSSVPILFPFSSPNKKVLEVLKKLFLLEFSGVSVTSQRWTATSLPVEGPFQIFFLIFHWEV